MNENEKIQELWQLLATQRQVMFNLLKTYLIQCNPDQDLIPEIKLMIEDQNIISENEMYDFLDKWKEYKRCLKSSIAIQQVESQKNNFEAMMAKAFPNGVK